MQVTGLLGINEHQALGVRALLTRMRAVNIQSSKDRLDSQLFEVGSYCRPFGTWNRHQCKQDGNNFLDPSMYLY